MSEDENDVYEPITQDLDVSQDGGHTEEVQEKESYEEDKKTQKSSQEYNWKEMRRRMRDLEKIAEEQAEYIRKLSEKPQEREPEEDLSALSDDEIVTAKQAKALAKKMAREVAQEVSRAKEAEQLEERVKNKYPDFDEVFCEENISFLKKNEPEIFAYLRTLEASPYKQATEGYRMVKKFVPSQKTERDEVQKAKQNVKKPIPSQVARPMDVVKSFEVGLTAEDKARLYREMREAANRG